MLVVVVIVKYTDGDHDYPQAHIGDRTCGILMQLISCLQCRRCPHYFLPAVDLFRGIIIVIIVVIVIVTVIIIVIIIFITVIVIIKIESFLLKYTTLSGKSPSSLDNAAKLAWRLLRELLTNGKALENL